MLELGERLRDAREALGLTQDQAALICNVTKRSIQNWERGQNKMSVVGLMGLARGLEVSGTPGGETTDLVVTLDANGKATVKLDPTPAGWDEAIITAAGCDPAAVLFV